MMMQNAQVHQMIMQQMMLGAIPKQPAAVANPVSAIDQSAALSKVAEIVTVSHVVIRTHVT